MSNRYYWTYVLFLFLRSNCCKKLTLNLITHKSSKHTIVSIEIKRFLYKLNHQKSIQSYIGGFLFLQPRH